MLKDQLSTLLEEEIDNKVKYLVSKGFNKELLSNIMCNLKDINVGDDLILKLLNTIKGYNDDSSIPKEENLKIADCTEDLKKYVGEILECFLNKTKHIYFYKEIGVSQVEIIEYLCYLLQRPLKKINGEQIINSENTFKQIFEESHIKEEILFVENIDYIMNENKSLLENEEYLSLDSNFRVFGIFSTILI